MVGLALVPERTADGVWNDGVDHAVVEGRRLLVRLVTVGEGNPGRDQVGDAF